LKIGIIGGGMTGLTVGSEFSKDGHEVTVFESREEYGGLVEAVKTGDVML